MIKHTDQIAFYHSYEGEKCKYTVFHSRIKSGYSREDAISKGSLFGKHFIRGSIDELGRECSICTQYKQLSEYNKSKSGIHGYMNLCRSCATEKKKQYREQTNRAKDREYKQRKRRLEIGQKLAFCKPIYIDGYPREVAREVMKYELKKGYLLYSKEHKRYTRLSTCDNHYHPQNNLCKKFYLINEKSGNSTEPQSSLNS